jgi:hypothetical protein
MVRRTRAFGNVASAVSNASTCAVVCAADNETRSRLVPSGTVGGRIAFTSRPCSRSCSLARSAASGAADDEREHRRVRRHLEAQGARTRREVFDVLPELR